VTSNGENSNGEIKYEPASLDAENNIEYSASSEYSEEECSEEEEEEEYSEEEEEKET
jgi:hypothetical protein